MQRVQADKRELELLLQADKEKVPWPTPRTFQRNSSTNAPANSVMLMIHNRTLHRSVRLYRLANGYVVKC